MVGPRFRLVVLTALLALFMRPAVYAQAWKGRGRVEGRVADQDGKPVAGADVKLRLGKAGNTGPDVKTDKKGGWAYLGLASGEWHIDIESPGYVPGTIVVKVSEFERTPLLDYKLEKAKPAEPEVAQAQGLPPEIMAAVKTGNEALEQKNYKVARENFEKVLAAVPDNMSLYFALSRSYYGEGNVPKAVEMLKKVTDKEPSNDTAWLLTANMLLEKGDLDAGREALEKVPAANIKDPSVYINVGVLYMNKNKNKEAEEYFGKAIDVAPDKGDGYYYRGLARVSLQKGPEAKADLTKFLEISPNAPEAEEARQLLKAVK